MEESTIRFTTDALVIKEANIGDNDRLITLMTRDMGVIRAFAVGAKSIKSKRGSATGLLSYSNFHLEKKGDTYKVLEATANKVFFGAGNDVFILSVAQYFCELCTVLGPVDTEGEEFLRLILNSLYFLTEKKRSVNLIKAITELRIATISGYAPSLLGCDSCGKFEDGIMHFKVDDGTLYCGDCHVVGAFPIDRTMLDAMRHIVYSEFDRLYSFEIPDDAAKRLTDITEKYIVYQSEHKFSTLDFYHSIEVI